MGRQVACTFKRAAALALACMVVLAIPVPLSGTLGVSAGGLTAVAYAYPPYPCGPDNDGQRVWYENAVWECQSHDGTWCWVEVMPD